MAAKKTKKKAPAKRTGQQVTLQVMGVPPGTTMSPLSVVFMVWLLAALSLIFFAMAVYRYA